MSLISIPNTFTVGQVIVASQHNSNFSTIYTDYNGNIDRTNLSASAGILDTQLGNITTAGKVSGSALITLNLVPSGSGALPAKNGGTGGDLSAAVQGTIPYFSSTAVQSALPVGTAGQVLTTQGSSANPTWTTSGMGAWVSKSVTTIYQAATDGIVTAFVQNANNNTNLQGITDNSATPSTIRARFSSSSGASGGSYCSIMFPVKKNDYYQVTYATADTITIYFIPIGS